jgi:hypothetical protein
MVKTNESQKKREVLPVTLNFWDNQWQEHNKKTAT